MNNKIIKLAILTHSISHFEVPFYKSLTAVPNIESTVIYWDKTGLTEEKFDAIYNRPIKWNIDLLSGYNNLFIKNIFELISILRKNKFDAAIIYGYHGFYKLAAIFICKILGTALILRGTATLLEKRGFFKSLIKKVLLIFIFKFFKGVLFGGLYNKEYYKYYGFKEEQMFFLPFSVDINRFLKLANKQKKEKENIKKALGISAEIIILFIGNFIPKKGPHIALKSFELFVKKFPDAILLMVGDGIMMADLKSFALEHNLEKKVLFLGFQDQQEVPRLYAVSDFVIFPSLNDETWARAVNEAMCYELPIIASQKVGATGDIVKNEINGFIIKENNAEELTEKMLILANDKKLREKMGRASKEIITTWTYENNIQNVVKAIRYAIIK